MPHILLVDDHPLFHEGLATPTQVGTLKTWTKVAAGNLASCGLRSDHSLWCWGSNTWGEISLPANNPGKVTGPLQISGPASGWQDVSIYDHTCGVGMDGTLWCWGENDQAQLGIGTLVSTETPTQVGTDTDWAQVKAGLNNTCALKSNGSIWCWGSARFGQLGNGSDIGALVPEKVGFVPGATAPRYDGFFASDWTALDTGLDTSCAIRQNGSAWCWGNGPAGALASGDGSNRDLASLVR